MIFGVGRSEPIRAEWNRMGGPRMGCPFSAVKTPERDAALIRALFRATGFQDPHQCGQAPPQSLNAHGDHMRCAIRVIRARSDMGRQVD